MSLPSVSVAECATCGTVAAEFGKVWGAAGYFKGSIVTYDITMKTKYLGVPEELALNFMDTPKEVVVAMADTQDAKEDNGHLLIAEMPPNPIRHKFLDAQAAPLMILVGHA